MRKISFYTLGCKLNQSETAVLAEQFKKENYEIVSFGEAVDVCVINTCTVTAKSDRRCLQTIRRVKKENPLAKIAVVGCYAQLNPEKLKKDNDVDFILGSDAKFDLFNMLDDYSGAEKSKILASKNGTFRNPQPGYFWNHTRAFAKIQDGCDSLCSYCAVPLARGRSRSDSLEHIVETVEKLISRGHKEIVLTGVHIGMYGRDLKPQKSLLEVLSRLEQIEGLARLRLSSLEPLEISDDLLDWLCDSQKVCHHFHVPLQSGDDEILKKMKRNYNVAQYTEVIKKLKKQFPCCGLGTDVIVGFPAETESNFKNTQQLIESLPFSYLHVFSYSKRPGTKAFNFPDQISPKIIKHRSEVLRQIAFKKKQDYYRSQIGQLLRVLWEEKKTNGWLYGLSDQYARVKAKVEGDLSNTISQVKIANASFDGLVGQIVS